MARGASYPVPMSEAGKGTDSKYERDQGRIALWLDPEDVAWLTKHCTCGTTSGHHSTECLRIRFRSGACLHAYDLDK
jgi:hypothetical protein